MAADLLIVLGLSGGIIGFAARYGGMPEKAGAALVALNLCVDFLVRMWVGQWDFSRFSTTRFLVDTAELALLFALAFRANRVWPIFSAAAQLVTVSGSLAVLQSGGGRQVAYWAVTQLPLFGQLAALALGTFFHMRRQAILGPYRDWRVTSSPGK